MKFIPKKQTGGLVNRYLQAHQYNLNQKAAPVAANTVVKRPLDGPHMISGPTITAQDGSIKLPAPQFPQVTPVHPAFAATQQPGVAVAPTVYPKVAHPVGTWAHAAITGEPVPPKWQMPIAQAATTVTGTPATVATAPAETKTAPKATPKKVIAKPAAKAKTKTYPGPDEMANRPLAKGMHQDYETGRTTPHYTELPAREEKTWLNPNGQVGKDKGKPVSKPAAKPEAKKPVVNKPILSGGTKPAPAKQESKLVDHKPAASTTKSNLVAKPKAAAGTVDKITITTKQMQDYANMPEHAWASLKGLTPTDLKLIKKTKYGK